MRPAMMALLGVVAFAQTIAAAGPPAPRVETSGGTARVLLDRSILRSPEVRKHVLSGLTSTFIVSLDRQDQYGLIEIRFEPWDEVFYVNARGVDQKRESIVIRSMPQLEAWWCSPRLAIATGLREGERVRVSLEVIPFSASEEADAKKWIARSLGERGPSAGQSSTPSAPSLFSAVVGSSIRRKPVMRYSWLVRIERPR